MVQQIGLAAVGDHHAAACTAQQRAACTARIQVLQSSQKAELCSVWETLRMASAWLRLTLLSMQEQQARCCRLQLLFVHSVSVAAGCCCPTSRGSPQRRCTTSQQVGRTFCKPQPAGEHACLGVLAHATCLSLSGCLLQTLRMRGCPTSKSATTPGQWSTGEICILSSLAMMPTCASEHGTTTCSCECMHRVVRVHSSSVRPPHSDSAMVAGSGGWCRRRTLRRGRT